MPRKLTDALLDDAAELMKVMSLREAGKRLGVGRDALSRGLRSRGVRTDLRSVRPSSQRKKVDEDLVCDMFRAGRSVKAIAVFTGATRRRISAVLQENNIQPRNRSEGMYARMAETPAADRKHLTEAAHRAVRGKTQRLQHRQLIARSRHRAETHIGAGENDICAALDNLGLVVSRQHPVDRYNVDIMVDGSVAVEVTGRWSMVKSSPYYLERIKKLRDSGHPVIYVTFHTDDVWPRCAHDVAAHIQSICGDPAARCKDWVITCTLNRYTVFRNELGQMASKPAPVSHTCTRREMDLCTTGEASNG